MLNPTRHCFAMKSYLLQFDSTLVINLRILFRPVLRSQKLSLKLENHLKLTYDIFRVVAKLCLLNLTCLCIQQCLHEEHCAVLALGLNSAITS
jgi:hypothetical protein